MAVLLIGLHAGVLFAVPGTWPRFKVRVTCFNGAPDVSSFGSGTSYGANGTLYYEGKMTCGVPGRVSEITWHFAQQRGEKDVYFLTRRFPIDGASVDTSSKEVEVSTQRVIVFQDEHQTIVIEPPTK